MSQPHKKHGRNGSGPPPGDEVYEGKNALVARSGAEDEDEEGEEEGGELSPEELAVLTEPPPAAPDPDRAAKMAADLAERARLKSRGELRHNGEEVTVVSTGAGWRAFLSGDPRGGVGDGGTPGEALADLKAKLGGGG